MTAERVFVTNDARILDGPLDPTDARILAQAGIAPHQRSRRTIVTAAEMLVQAAAAGAADQPATVEAAIDGSAALVRLGPESLGQLRQDAERTMHVFAAEALLVLGGRRAAWVRDLRVRQRLTWRGVARACGRRWGGDWRPIENQLMGLALCQRAAELLGEDARTPPWN